MPPIGMALNPGPRFGRGIAIGQRPQGQAVFSARVSMDQDGRATLYSSVPDTGVGFSTVARRVIAEDLGLSADDVSVSRETTDDFSFDTGAGAGTSVGAANASLGAAREVRRKLTGLAAEFYGWPEERITFKDGRVSVPGDSEGGATVGGPFRNWRPGRWRPWAVLLSGNRPPVKKNRT